MEDPKVKYPYGYTDEMAAFLPETPQEKEEREEDTFKCDICKEQRPETQRSNTTMGNICIKCMCSLQGDNS